MTLYHNSSIKTVILNMFPYNVCSLLALLNWIHARSLDYYDVFRFNICSIHASSTSLCEIHYGSLDNYVAMSCRYMFQGPKRRPPRRSWTWMAIMEIAPAMEVITLQEVLAQRLEINGLEVFGTFLWLLDRSRLLGQMWKSLEKVFRESL